MQIDLKDKNYHLQTLADIIPAFQWDMRTVRRPKGGTALIPAVALHTLGLLERMVNSHQRQLSL